LGTSEHCYSQMIDTASITTQFQHNAFQRNPSAEITFREVGKVEMNRLQSLV
jgi:hypothetical protein